LLDEFLFAFPQSSQVFGYNAYCWDNPDKAVEEIEDAFKISKKNSILKMTSLLALHKVRNSRIN